MKIDTSNLNDFTIRHAIEIYFSDVEIKIHDFDIDQIKNIADWNVSNVKDMKYLFFERNMSNINLSNWIIYDTIIDYIFQNCTHFDNFTLFNPQNVKSMVGLFSGSDFNQEVNFDTSQVTNMSNMFKRCTKFNSPIVFTDTSRVTNMDQMFYDCKKFNQNISTWNIDNVVSNIQMFYNCPLSESNNPFEQPFEMDFQFEPRNTKITFSRRDTFTKSDQSFEGTCRIHQEAKIASKYLRTLYGEITSATEDAVCDELFDTVECNIFDCILRVNCNNQTIINSAVLFHLLYNILLLNIDRNIKNTFDFLFTTLTTMTKSKISSILKFKVKHKNKKIIEGIKTVLTIIELMKMTPYKFNTFFFLSERKVNVTLLKKILDNGFYAGFSVDGDPPHAMIISGYEQSTDKYTIKNSWGEDEYYDETSVFRPHNNKAPSSMFYDSANIQIVRFLYFIVPEILTSPKMSKSLSPGKIKCSGWSCFSWTKKKSKSNSKTTRKGLSNK